jgi:peptide methionine sulfoxide reductase msrA/msrB
MTNNENKYQTAYFAAGCFWGTQYHLSKIEGVVDTTSGFMGGKMQHPSYQQVKTGATGHLETVRVVYDPEKTSYDTLLKMYFEIHDFTQTDGQGPDIGSQYLSAIFYVDEEQKQLAEKYVNILEGKGYKVATRILKATTFWEAEEYHQDYYFKTGGTPYCHVWRKIFD